MSPMRGWLFLTAACGLLLLTSCGQNEQALETTDWTPLQIAQAVMESQSELPPMTAILQEDERYDGYIDGYYWVDLADIADGAIFCAETASAQEIAVLRLAAGADIDKARQALSDYSQRRAGAFTGYLPDEAALAENAFVAARGDMAALLICREPDLAEAAFQRAFTEAPPDDLAEPVNQPPDNGAERHADPDDNAEPDPEVSPADTAEPAPPQPEQEEDPLWKYDSARLLDAWRQGDWSGLTQRDQDILNVCQTVIGRTGFGDLSDYEKELAVHDWMLANGSYDSNQLSNLPQYQENPDNDNPYGFLIGGVGICRGYTSTFQLFMDLLGIECISVEGQSHSTREEHAWNMVRLDGEWYCVDVTWDDPISDLPVSTQRAHRYFNVTSEFLRFTQHYWDEGNVPMAFATRLVWGSDAVKNP